MAEHRRPSSGSIVYSTAWFDVVSKQVANEAAPYYSLRVRDYVTVVALTQNREMVLVRQYRPAVEQHTLELPSGHVEKNQTPEESARQELAEETGFGSSRLEFLGTLLSDTGRNENRTWCYLAADVEHLPTDWVGEEKIEVVLVPIDDVQKLILRGEFTHALNIAALMLAILRRKACLPSLFCPPTSSEPSR